MNLIDEQTILTKWNVEKGNPYITDMDHSEGVELEENFLKIYIIYCDSIISFFFKYCLSICTLMVFFLLLVFSIRYFD